MEVRKTITVCIALTVATVPLESQLRDSGSITQGQTFKVWSTALQEDRMVYVYEPPSYRRDRTSHSVLYLLDAEDNSAPVAGLVDWFVQSRRIPGLLVVGIVNDTRANCCPRAERRRVRNASLSSSHRARR